MIARYGYDVTGRRIAKRVYSSASGGTVAYTRFVYHGSHVAFETDSAGTIGLRYTWGLAVDDLIAIHDGANHYYAVQDPIRSVRGLVKRDGTWVLAKRYGPYGAVIEASDNGAPPSWALRYRWTGREYDAETGFYFFRSRYYDVNQRRFVQEDAIGYAGGPSLYQYGEGQPLSGRDPDGLRMDAEFWGPSERTLRILARLGCWSDDCSGAGGSSLWGSNWGSVVYIDGAYAGRSQLAFLALMAMRGIDARLDRNDALRIARAATAFGNLTQALMRDCSQGGCPSPQEMRSNPELMRLLNRFFDLSNRAGVEFGAFLVMDADQRITIGPSGRGVVGHFDFRTLGPMPANTIAAIHTHPDEHGIPGGAPFSGDYPPHAGIYGIVTNRDYIWFLTPWSPPGYCFPRLDGGPAC